MKFKGKKAIMAAALSAIAAANSFSMVAMAEDPTIYAIDLVQGWTQNSSKGSLSISHKRAAAGTPITVAATPVSGGGVSVTVYGKGNQIIYSSGLSTSTVRRSFIMPGAPVTVSINWAFPVSNNDDQTSSSETKPDPVTPTPTPSAPTPTPTNLRGDADVNGVVNVQDATLVLKHAAKLTKLTGQGYINADVNNDGNINVADATEILKIAAKLA